MTTVALVCMVKDEAPRVLRLLGSVGPYVDSYVFLDTGSTDATVEVIETFALQGHQVTLEHRAFDDFGSSRTALMQLARGRADYLLLMDADMTLVTEDRLPELEADAYMLHHNCVPEYRNARLVRGDLPWSFVGKTHEVIEKSGGYWRLPLDEWSVQHHGDGASRSVKFERDLLLLHEQWDEDHDPRTAFYLGQTYKDLDRIGEAVAWYRIRAAMGGWQEEEYYAQLMVGRLLGDKDELMAAYRLRPTRREALNELLVLTPPSDDILFVTN